MTIGPGAIAAAPVTMTEAVKGEGTVTTQPAPASRRSARASRRVGYLVAIGVNAVVLWVVNHLLEWGWPPFLTDAFADLLPVLQFSIGATIAVNVLWVFADPPWCRHLAQIGLNLIGLVVAVRTWQIFPFDFADEVWATVVRLLIVLGMLGLVAATIGELVKLVGVSGDRSSSPTGRSHPLPG